jgi:hypothetical protein
MKKKLLASSVRPPYLLMRRLTMLQQLGEISATALPERTIAVTQFCQGLSHALPEEKPLIMTSPAWQDAFCRSGKGKVHEQAHGLGLTYGLRELEFFEKIAAAVSHKGQLRVKIPPQDLSEKDVWIKLEPQPDVAAGIWQTTLEIAGGSVTADFLNPMIGAPSPAELQTYLCTSLLGETSFSVGNGYMKVLQLPSGHYRYTLYELPEDDANWAPAKAQKSSHGTIDWLRANPHPVIASLSGPQDDESTLVER